MNSPEPGFDSEQHEFQEEWLSAYLDGELASHQVAIVEQRLQIDSVAQQTLLDLQRVRKLVGNLPPWTEDSITAEQVTDTSPTASDRSRDAELGLQKTVEAQWDEIVEGKFNPATETGNSAAPKEEMESLYASPYQDPSQSAAPHSDFEPESKPTSESDDLRSLSPVTDESPVPTASSHELSPDSHTDATVPDVQQIASAAEESLTDAISRPESESYTDPNSDSAIGPRETDGDSRAEASPAVQPGEGNRDDQQPKDSTESKVTFDEKAASTDQPATLPVETDGWKRPLAIAASVLAMASIGYLLWPLGKPASDLALRDPSPAEPESSLSPAAASEDAENEVTNGVDFFRAERSQPAEMAGRSRVDSIQPPGSLETGDKELQLDESGASEPFPSSPNAAVARGLPQAARSGAANIADRQPDPPEFESASVAASDNRPMQFQLPDPSALPSPELAGKQNPLPTETPDLEAMARKGTGGLDLAAQSMSELAMNDAPTPLSESVVADATAAPGENDIAATKQSPTEDRVVADASSTERALEPSFSEGSGFVERDPSSPEEAESSVNAVVPAAPRDSIPPGLSPRQTSWDLPIARTQAWSADEIESALQRIAPFARLARRSSNSTSSRQRNDQDAARAIPVLISSLAGSPGAQELFASLMDQNQDLIAEPFSFSAANSTQEASMDSESAKEDLTPTARGLAQRDANSPILLLMTREQAEELLASAVPDEKSSADPGKFWFAGAGRPLSDIAADEKIILLINVQNN